MKKSIVLLAGLVCIWSVAAAQSVKDPQQELNQVQQKIRTLQSADQQIKGQVSTLKKDQAALTQEVKSSLNAGDSLMKAGTDSLRVANERGQKNEEAITSLRSSLSLQQNLVIIALVLVICLFLLFLWQRRMVRTLAQSHEADVKKLQDALAGISRKTEEEAASLKMVLMGELENVKALLKQTTERITADQKISLEAEKNRREEAVSVLDKKLSAADEATAGLNKKLSAVDETVASLNKKLSAVDEKAGSAAEGAMSFAKQEAEHCRKDLADLRKTIQEVSKSSKGRGNSAE